MAETRKIAAILAADVVGYQPDDERGRRWHLGAASGAASDLIDPTVALHNGRVVQAHRRRTLVEFRSVVDAVRCAIEVQNGMVERNAGVPQDRRIVFRIGIHLGDVVEESDGDLMGDGVNIAARLEGSPGREASVLSEDAYRQVSGGSICGCDLGPKELKNIAEPVRVYSLQVGVSAGAKPASKSPARRACPLWCCPSPTWGAVPNTTISSTASQRA